MKKTIKNYGIVAITLLLSALSSCDKNTESSKTPIIANIHQTDCLASVTKDFNDLHADSIVVVCSADSIQVLHFNHIINCGQQLDVNFNVNNDTLHVKEIASGLQANCMCELNNGYCIKDLDKGKYCLWIESCEDNDFYFECNTIYCQWINI